MDITPSNVVKTWHDLKNVRGVVVLVASMFGIVVLALIAVVIGLYYIGETRGIRQEIVDPQPSIDRCAGDILTFTVDVQVIDAPAIYMSVETVWDAELGRTIILDLQPEWSIVKVPTHMTRLREWIVPLLPPGHYELRRAVQAAGRSRAAVVSIPFAVPENCP